MRKGFGRAGVSVLLLAVVISCGFVLATCSTGGTKLAGPTSLLFIVVNPYTTSANAGQPTQFSATGTYSDGSTQDLTASAAWTSSDTGTATIVSGTSGAGLASALSPGTATIQATIAKVSGTATLAVSQFAGVLTYHNDLARTGANPYEKKLSSSNVNANSFGKVFSDPVDGYVYAQPLYVPAVSIPGSGVHNVVYVATENDTVYAFDADSAGPPLWKVSLLEPGETPVSSGDVNCDNLVPQIGITSTPVIDPTTQMIYVEAMSKLVSGSTTTYFQRLHALDVTTGTEEPGSPVVISGTAPGTSVSFDPLTHLNRPGLALVGGVIYIGFGSHCDNIPYEGWLFAYDASDLEQEAIFESVPTGSKGAIWQGGGAPSADSAGNIYVSTGNGTFDANSGGADYGDSYLKLFLSGNSLEVTDYFTPFNMPLDDLDLGSADLLLLPDSVGSGSHPHLMISAGKEGTIYLVDRDDLGKFCSSCSSTDTQIVQEVQGVLGTGISAARDGNFSSPAYWQGTVYFGSVRRNLDAFSISRATLSTAPVSQTAEAFGYPGTTPSVSSDGSRNGILWTLDISQYGTPGPAVLHAYLASDLGEELYNSSQASGNRDTAGDAVKFTVPTIANGKVYIGTQTELDVYGLLRKPS